MIAIIDSRWVIINQRFFFFPRAFEIIGIFSREFHERVLKMSISDKGLLRMRELLRRIPLKSHFFRVELDTEERKGIMFDGGNELETVRGF